MITVPTSPLVGLPRPAFDESPSSWLARASLSQAASMQDVLQSLDLKIRAPQDLDFFVLSGNLSTAMLQVGLSGDSFPVARRVLANLRSVNSDGRTYLLRNAGQIKYRYCAPCLSEQQSKYLPIHWRFKAWQWCPLHLSVMRDRCPRCNAALEFPHDLLRAGPEGEGVGSLDYCLKCGHRLSLTAEEDRGRVHPDAVDPWTRTLMRNGRALLAALYYKHLFTTTSGSRFRLATLRRFTGLIPNNVSIWKPPLPVAGFGMEESKPLAPHL